MKKGVLLFLTILVFAIGAAGQKRDFIGYEHKGVVYGETLPNGLKDQGGGLLSDENYGVTRFAKGRKHYLLLEKITRRDRKGVPNWIVKDALEFGRLGKNQEFLFSYSSPCTIRGEEAIDTVVLADFNRKTRKYRVISAWKANLEKERFEKISIRGIDCGREEPDEQFADF